MLEVELHSSRRNRCRVTQCSSPIREVRSLQRKVGTYRQTHCAGQRGEARGRVDGTRHLGLNCEAGSRNRDVSGCDAQIWETNLRL